MASFTHLTTTLYCLSSVIIIMCYIYNDGYLLLSGMVLNNLRVVFHLITAKIRGLKS